MPSSIMQKGPMLKQTFGAPLNGAYVHLRNTMQVGEVDPLSVKKSLEPHENVEFLLFFTETFLSILWSCVSRHKIWYVPTHNGVGGAGGGGDGIYLFKALQVHNTE